ncbi:MAG: hypothetical protein ACYCY0_08500 [Acidithiobacillus ferrivorans]
MTSTQSRTIELPGFIGKIDNFPLEGELILGELFGAVTESAAPQLGRGVLQASNGLVAKDDRLLLFGEPGPV